MATRNEKATDLIVAQKLKDVGIKFCPNGSSIADIKKALKSASKRGNGRNGYPEYVAQVGDFLLVIEDKADSAHQAKYIDDSKTSLLMDTTSIVNFAENGAVHYAKHIVQHSSFKKIIAIGCSGQDEQNIYIRPIFVSPAGAKLLPRLTDFAPLSTSAKIKKYYNDVVLEKKPIAQVELEDILKRSASLHEDLRNYGNLGDHEKPLVVSAILLALSEDDFDTESLTGDSVKTDGMKIYDALSSHMDRVHVGPQDKKERVLNQFLLIKDRPHLSEISPKLGKSPLRYFAEYLDSNIMSAIRSNTPEDVLGRFYGEFMSYSGGNGQSLGVVLTPKHITELFADLAEIKPEDNVLDPCCGTAGFLIAAMHRMLAQAETPYDRQQIRANRLHGIELRDDMFSIATTNMILRGDGKSNLSCGDFFKATSEELRAKNFTVGLMNPPYSQGKKKVTAELTELKFIRHLLDSLADGARCVVIVPLSTMVGKTNADKDDKRYIYDHHTLEGVITLNPDTFHGVGTMPCIAVFTAHKPHQKDKLVKFVDFSDDGYKVFKQIGLLPTPSVAERKKLLLDCWHQGKSAPSSFIIRTTVEPEDEWLHSFYNFNDEKPTEADFIKTIGDYLTFEFSMVMRGREDLFAYYKGSNTASNRQIVRPLSEVVWRPFRLLDYFDYRRGDQKDMTSLSQGDEMLVSARNVENGLKGFYCGAKSHKRFPGDCITLNNDGDGGVGLAYYQPHEFLLDTHVYALYPKKPMTRFAQLFISRSISMCRPCFSHGRSISKSRLKTLKVMLPAASDGKPDFAYMDAYGREMVCATLSKYLDYLKKRVARRFG